MSRIIRISNPALNLRGCRWGGQYVQRKRRRQKNGTHHHHTQRRTMPLFYDGKKGAFDCCFLFVKQRILRQMRKKMHAIFIMRGWECVCEGVILWFSHLSLEGNVDITIKGIFLQERSIKNLQVNLRNWEITEHSRMGKENLVLK